ELIEERAMLHWQEGDLAAARAALDRLAEARSTLRDEMGQRTAALARGRILLAQGEHTAAQAELAPALDYFRERKLYYYEAQASMALASCALTGREEGESWGHLKRAVDLAARYDYEYWLLRELRRDPRLFASEQTLRLLPGELRRKLSAGQSAPPPARVSPAAEPASDLTINMLGPVEVYRDPARPLAADAWVSKRAREVLCFIASRPHRRVSKDGLIEAFWGDLDFETIEKRLHPTISYVRKALNSNQILRQNFLLYRDGDYLLNPEFSCRVDVEEFDRLAAEGEAARRRGQAESCHAAYEEATGLYRGEFLQGSSDHWIEEQRAYYRGQYLRMLEKLAAAAQEAGEWERSLALARKILLDDPFREDVHCMVMRAHAAQGNRVAVKGQYETLRDLLRRELGVEPAQATRKVYAGLVE
ncbi:MAG: hypothetical protein LC800_19780, partial [Acidobacteria bacterium]|nr:hypothetical protein [Acidobacteriota bacterium]